MKKRIVIVSCLLMIFFLAACGENQKYQEAKSALDSGDYNAAIVILDELNESGYEGSDELLKEAKYQYVKANLDRDDARSVLYLNELKRDNYKDASDLYSQLYSWKVDIAINTTKQSSVHQEQLDVTSKMFPFYYFNFKTYDGPPDGEYRGKYEVVFSNGEKATDTYIGRDNDYYYSVLLSATETPTGKTTFNIYGENGELLATKTSYIS